MITNGKLHERNISQLMLKSFMPILERRHYAIFFVCCNYFALILEIDSFEQWKHNESEGF